MTAPGSAGGSDLSEERPPGETFTARSGSFARGAQPLWFTWTIRMLLGVALMVLAVAILFTNTQLSELRRALPWLHQTISRVEQIWPTVNMVHAVMFAALGLLLALAFPVVRLRTLFLALAVLAVLTEFVQIWIPGRTASVGEVLLDVVAGGLGMGVVWLVGWTAQPFVDTLRP